MGIEPYFRDAPEGVELRIHAQPGASKTEIVGQHGEALKIRVKASPVAGQANRELCQFLADRFGVIRKHVQLVSGESSRQKCVLIKGKILLEIRETLFRILAQNHT